MAVSSTLVSVSDAEVASRRCIVASGAALGNGVREEITDIVFVKPDAFEASRTAVIAREVAAINRALVDEGRPYLLIGFGRWGSSDPWLGIPVDWSSIAGARAIVEADTDTMHVEASEGSHFFHNLSSFGVTYFTVRPGLEPAIAWDWLQSQPAVNETPYVRHARAAAPLTIKVDGRSARGVILRGSEPTS
jgi:hypothetical protein